MIKTLKYIVFSMATLCLVACESQFEDVKPAASVEESVALSSDKNIRSLLVGAYDAFTGGRLFGGYYQLHSELLAGDPVARDIRWRGTFADPGEVFTKSMLVTNGDASAAWLNTYNALNVVNTILANLSTVEQANRARVEGEALFMRGVMYYQLACFFAKQYNVATASNDVGVPLVLTPASLGNFVEAKPSRASVAAVYQQVLADLNKAEAQLPESNGFYANRYIAAAFLSRVHLQMGNFAQARDAANRVIQSNRYAMLVDYSFCFNNIKNTTEDVFAVQITVQDGTNNMATFFGGRNIGGRGDVQIQAPHLSLYETGDARRAFFYTDPGTGRVHTGKWRDVVAANINIIRLPEMYLTRAEANFRLGTTVGANPVDDINRIRTRAGIRPLSSTELSLDRILRERQLELAFEGVRIQDIKRTGGRVGSRLFSDDRLIFPVPDRELKSNPNLTQNSGY
jgi:starch-binding outer membrane protein, SusD/RagB family